jgi:hypothetical protein
VAITRLKELQCGTCGVWFALPEVLYDTLAAEGGFFTCPNGHRRGWDKGTLQKQNERLQQEQARLEQALAAEHRRLIAAQAQTTKARKQVVKMQKRAAAGVCPCCNRTFNNMARHMKTKHPEFKTADIVPIKKEQG